MYNYSSSLYINVDFILSIIRKDELVIPFTKPNKKLKSPTDNGPVKNNPF